MYRVRVEGTFAAAHHLVGYPGDCANVHGHTWKVVVFFVGKRLDEVGMLVDFKELKRVLKSVLGWFDHKDLNSVSPFDVINPTAENLARELFHLLKINSPSSVRLERVQVWESDTSYAEYGRR